MNWVLHHKAVTGSTNRDARAGRPGDVFTAGFQTAGRGRLDHKWLAAPDECLMMSAVLDVADLPPEQIATLPLVVGLAVLRGIERLKSQCSNLQLKWPNDVLVGGRKIAGILCERQGEMVIAGVGINVRQRKFAKEIEKRAISLAMLGTIPAMEVVRDAILAMLGEAYQTWRQEGFAALYPEIAAHDFLRGQPLGIVQTDDDCAPIKGMCHGIQSDGSLLVGEARVYAGEAHVLL
ncbi:MAG: biotin--[acetyl-CoA-carboxylase] ligase [Kiritimatiellia bacterium]